MEINLGDTPRPPPEGASPPLDSPDENFGIASSNESSDFYTGESQVQGEAMPYDGVDFDFSLC
ncbi:MAG: hypothetical protein HY666_03215 [Chloroflexi bacterium]|nr:hypothetical protein [Chloroflexota bacterium]